MSLFYKTFAHGRIGRLTREEEDSISRGLTPYRFLRPRQRMAPFSKRASSWGRGRSFGGASKAKQRLTFSRGLNIRALGVASGYTRTGGFYGRFNRGSQRRELKFFDTALSFPVDATGEVVATGQLNLIPQGSGQSQRVGRKAFIKSIQIQGKLQLVSSATVASGVVIILIVLDKQANGAPATAANVMTGTNFNTALKNMENSERFVILRRIVRVMTSSAGVASALNSVTKTVKWYKKLNIPIEFDNQFTDGRIDTIRSNNIFILASTGGLIDDLATFTGTCRLRYDD